MGGTSQLGSLVELLATIVSQRFRERGAGGGTVCCLRLTDLLGNRGGDVASFLEFQKLGQGRGRYRAGIN